MILGKDIAPVLIYKSLSPRQIGISYARYEFKISCETISTNGMILACQGRPEYELLSLLLTIALKHYLIIKLQFKLYLFLKLY